MITIRKGKYSLDDLRDLRDILSKGYEEFLSKNCSIDSYCEICSKYYLCDDIISAIHYLQKTIELRDIAKK